MLIAMLDSGERDHVMVVDLLRSNSERRIIPSPVLVEVDYWMSKYLRPEAMARFLENIVSGAFHVEDLTTEDYDRVAALLRTYSDSDIGLVDAAVLAVVERLREPKLATLDRRHFGMLRPYHVESLRLLPD